MVQNGLVLQKTGQLPQKLDETVRDDKKSHILQSGQVQRNVVTLYNQDTFEISKVRVNRVITARQLVAKIVSVFELSSPQEVIIRIGDLNLTFDSNTSDSELNKRLFSELNFDESNLIGVRILVNEKKNELIRRKQERLAEDRRLKKEKEQSKESLQVIRLENSGIMNTSSYGLS